MKRRTPTQLLLTILPLVLALSIGVYPQAERISILRSRVAQINRRLSRCQKVTHDVRERFRSLEGDTLEAYLCGGAPRKIVVTHYGETYKIVEEYYYWEGQVFFIASRHFSYQGTFGRVVRVEGERYYFAEGRLIEWRGKGGRAVKAESTEWAARERELLGKARELQGIVRTGKDDGVGGQQSNHGLHPTRLNAPFIHGEARGRLNVGVRHFYLCMTAE